MEHNLDYVNLVEKAKQRDHDAFTELYTSAYSMVYTTCLGHLRNQEDAEDTAQEVFITAYKKLNTLHDNKTFYGWIKTIAVNTSLNKIAARKNNISYDDAIESNEYMGDDNLENLPDSVIMEDAKRQALLEIMDSNLSEVQYQTIFMFYYNEMSIDQIATTMNCSVNTVKTRLKSARVKIKSGIEDYEKKTGDSLCAAGTFPALGMLFKSTLESATVPSVPFSGFELNGISGAFGGKRGSRFSGESAPKAEPKPSVAKGAKASSKLSDKVSNAYSPNTKPAATPNAASDPVPTPSWAKAQTPKADPQMPTNNAVNGLQSGVSTGVPTNPVKNNPVAKPGRGAGTSASTGAGAGIATKAIAIGVASIVGLTGLIGVGVLIKNKMKDDDRRGSRSDREESDAATESGVMETEGVNQLTIEILPAETNPFAYLNEGTDAAPDVAVVNPFEGQTFEVGGTVTFGNYAGEDISWLVLDENDGKYLVLSEYALETGVYDWDDTRALTWAECECRIWLNNGFIEAAFSPEIRDRIVLTHVTADPNPSVDVNQGIDTEDEVFLLSIDEVYRYLDDTTMTCYVSQNILNNSGYEYYDGTCCWWLRTAGYRAYHESCFATVDFTFGVYEEGLSNYDDHAMSNDMACFRPAMWVDTNSVVTTVPAETTAAAPTETTAAAAPQDTAFNYEVSDFLHIEEREIVLSTNSSITLVQQVPQFTLADADTQNELNNRLCSQCISMQIRSVSNSVIIVDIYNCYELGGMDAGPQLTEHVIDLTTGRSLNNREILDMAGYEGQSMHDVCFNPISGYSMPDYTYTRVSDPAWPDVDARNFFKIDANFNLFYTVWITEGDDPAFVSLSGEEYVQADSIWSFHYEFVEENYYYVGITDFVHDPL